jgi:chromate reductase, NAD(P)H dehydrogenase (quinone)
LKKIYAISGSASFESANRKLLYSLQKHFSNTLFDMDEQLLKLPLYIPEKDCAPYTHELIIWRKKILESDAVIISTPEYLHNIPAVLKNGLEWLKTNGELYNKKLLPITFTPHPPRGKHAMLSLRNSLVALQARPVVELQFYANNVVIENDHYQLSEENSEILEMAVNLLL